MRLAMAQPCLGSSEMVLRIRRSRVPCTRSLGFPIFQMIYNTPAIVDSQGEHGAFLHRPARAVRAGIERALPGMSQTICGPMRYVSSQWRQSTPRSITEAEDSPEGRHAGAEETAREGASQVIRGIFERPR